MARDLKSKGWEITGGGGLFPEEYIAHPITGRFGSAYPDITAVREGRVLRVNTIDTLRDGLTPTSREAANAIKIDLLRPGDDLLLIPKPKW